MLSQTGPILVSARKCILDQKCQTQLLSHFDFLKIIRFLSSALTPPSILHDIVLHVKVSQYNILVHFVPGHGDEQYRCLRVPWFLLVACLAYSVILKTEAVCSFGTPVNF
jgi:hypothetical protein